MDSTLPIHMSSFFPGSAVTNKSIFYLQTNQAVFLYQLSAELLNFSLFSLDVRAVNLKWNRSRSEKKHTIDASGACEM